MSKILSTNIFRDHRRIEFRVESTDQLTEQEALEIQSEEGKHPAGYGFYDFKTFNNGGTWVAIWNCGASAD